MRRTSKGVLERRSTYPSPCEIGEERSNSNQLAAMAALTFARQAPCLVLPANLSAPSSYTFVQGEDKMLQLAKSLVLLGLGSVEDWYRSEGNTTRFVCSALNEWLVELGATRLHNHVDLNLGVFDCVEEMLAKEGKLFILVGTEDGCGALFLGEGIDRLEGAEQGLGHAFYTVLASTLNQWMEVYGRNDALYFFDRWQESIEMDMQGEDEPETTFEQYCKSRQIALPDSNQGVSACVLTHERSTKARFKTSLDQLARHGKGPFSDLVEPVLEMARTRLGARQSLDDEVLSLWDDGPLPNWLLAFTPNDAVTQAFDEESQTMHESSHSPTWIESFDPESVADVKRVLCHARNLLAINLQLVRLKTTLDRMAQTAKLDHGKGSHHGSTDRRQFDPQLRAA